MPKKNEPVVVTPEVEVKEEDLFNDVVPAEEEEISIEDLEEATAEKPKSTPQPTAQASQGWFKKGSAAVDEFVEKQAELSKLRQEKYAPVFHLKADQSATIVFIDDEPFLINQHTIKVGDQFHTLTCCQDFAPCALCSSGVRTGFAAYYTVIDTRSYTKKDGTIVKFTKKLFPAKGRTVIKRLSDEKVNKKGLVGSVITFKRYTDKEAGCGNILENKGKLSKEAIISKFGEDAVIPLDYMKLLAPPTADQLAALGYGEGEVVGSARDINDDLLSEL